MSTDAFLTDIIANPEDDTPRLIYADWLEEHGQPERAEFIRLQIEQAALPQSDLRWWALEDRAADLLATHEQDWLGDLPENLWSWRFTRGFLDCAVPGQQKTLEGFDGLFPRHPISATELWLEDNRYDSTRRLANSPWLERIRELTLVQSTLVKIGRAHV